jgi:hypothetical protein
MSANAREAGTRPSNEPGPERPSERETGSKRPSEREGMSRKAAWVLVALCAWTLYVWITRVYIIAGQDQSAGFKVVHGILAAISIMFGLAAGWIGVRRLRAR